MNGCTLNPAVYQHFLTLTILAIGRDRVAEAVVGVLVAEGDKGLRVQFGGDPVEGVDQAVAAGADGVVLPARADR